MQSCECNKYSGLNDLKNIIDEIVPDKEATFFNDQEALELYETCKFIMEEFIRNNPKIITEPDFEDIFNDNMDEPLGGSMGDLIARTLAQRNQDLEKIHNENAKKQEAEKWLKAENTSVKSINEETSTPIKYIKIGDELSTTLEELNQAKPKKTLSWSSQLDSNSEVQSNNDSTLDIFSKLKTIQEPTIQPIIQPKIQPTIEEKVDKLLILMSQMESKIDFLMKQQNTINI
jgi:hypothetical protein